MRLVRIVTMVSALILLAAGAFQVSAEAPASNAFERTWARTDRPVADDVVDRTWMWGPEPFTAAIEEEYAGAPGGTRMVQYYDKSRMEDNAYRGSDPWDVTNGLLVTELMTGQMQTGDDAFVPREPAEIVVAGDPSSTSVPTYAALAGLMDDPPHGIGSIITSTVGHDGTLGDSPQLAAYSVTVARSVAETGHTIAEPFWQFMASAGPVEEDGQVVNDALFLDPFYATGYPLTEAHWTRAVVNGSEADVLVQAFQRRVLTYTPSNPSGWQVESGNVGRHYYEWRHEQDSGQLEGGVLATFAVGDETFKVWVTNPDTIDQLFALQAGESDADIPIGPIEYGSGVANHNAPWNWHYDPDAIEMTEAAIELCDATPSYVEEHLTEFVETVGSYCPWNAELVDLVDYRTAGPVETPPTEEPNEEPSPEPTCDPAYPDFCIPPPPPDLDCNADALNGEHNFTVLAPDPHDFDIDGDGIGCEADESSGGNDVGVIAPTLPGEEWDGPVKVIDTNVEGALVCIYAASDVTQDGKPGPIDATEDDCELLLVGGKDGGGAGQGEPDTFFANLGEDSTASIAFTEDTNELSAIVQVEGLPAGDDFSAVIAGFGGCDLNSDGDCDDAGEEAGGENAVCSPDADATLPNDFSGDAILDLGSATADDEGDLTITFDDTLTVAETQALGDFEDNVVVVTNAAGETVACGIIEAGSAGLETPEDAAARLGAVVVGETDADGDVAFGLPAGDYFAVINADGFELAVEEFTLDEDETEINEVNLTPD